MRRSSLLVITLLAAGCASHGKHSASTEPAQPLPPVYAERTATVLAFDPPTAPFDASAALSRDARQPAAVVGYDEVTVTSFYLRTDDRLSDDFGDNYDRRAFSVRSGVSYR